MAGGVVVALIGAGLGWAVMRDADPPPIAEPGVVAPASKPLEVVVVAPPSQALPTQGERLEVLPPPGGAPRATSANVAVAPPPPRQAAAQTLAEAAVPVTPTSPRSNAASTRTPRAEVAAPVTPPPPRVLAQAPPPRIVAQAPPPPVPREAPNVVQAAQEASIRSAPEPRRFDACRDAPSRAYEMVCSDRQLAEADRRMKRAYSAALAAGAPPEALRRDQDDWLDVREDAARVSRRAVADIYRQRTQELVAMADGRWD